MAICARVQLQPAVCLCVCLRVRVFRGETENVRQTLLLLLYCRVVSSTNRRRRRRRRLRMPAARTYANRPNVDLTAARRGCLRPSYNIIFRTSFYLYTR